MDIQAVLKANPLFRGLDRRALRAIQANADWIELGGGQYLFRAGDESEALYVIASGRIRLVRDPGSSDVPLMGEIGAGDTVGEISIIRAEKHAANAIALRDTALVRISRQVFERLVERHPRAMLAVTRIIVDRVRTAAAPPQRESVRSTRTFAIVPAHPGIDIPAIARGLAAELGGAAATLRLDGERVEQALGAGAAHVDFGAGTRNRQLTGWLTQLEDRYRYMVYQGSAAPDAWTRRCLRQADRVLLVAHADQRPFVSRNLEWLKAQHLSAPQELVLLHGEADGYSALDWRRITGSGFHHRVHRRLPDTDIGHLARMVSGRGVCLVLGGGGARGFAHVGLVRALQEKGIAIDAVAGTSMGAMVAAMTAMGMDAPQMLASLRETFVTGRFLSDFSLSRFSLISAEKFRKQLGTIFGERRIEDLAIPFHCLSTNLTRGVSVVHDQGPLATWVAASMAVPGIAPPIVHRGELLVDGGLLSAIPFDTMAEMGRGQVIVSDVSRASDLRVEMDEDAEATTLPSVGAAARHLNMFRILFHAATLTSERESRDIDSRADLALHMPVGDTSMFDWDELDGLVYRAYCYADERLDAWLAERGDPIRARVLANQGESSRSAHDV